MNHGRLPSPRLVCALLACASGCQSWPAERNQAPAPAVRPSMAPTPRVVVLPADGSEGLKNSAPTPPTAIGVEPPRPRVAAPVTNPPEVEESPAPFPVPLTSDEALSQLQGLGVQASFDEQGHVCTIDATGSRITDADLALFESFPGLRQINLRGTTVSDAGLAALRSSDAIEFLGLSQTALTDAGVAELPRFSGVTFVTLADTPITDRSVVSLSRMPQLQGLNIKGTRITANGASKLQAALPACKVVADADPFDPAVTFQRESTPVESGAATLIAPPAPEAPPPNGPQLMSALVSGATQRWDDAALSPEARLEQLLSRRLLEPEVLEALGDVAAEDGNWPQAIASYQAAVEMTPENKSLRFKLGTVLAEAGDVDEARGQFMLSVGPAEAHYNLAVIHHRRGREFESIESLRNSLAWDESFEPAHQMLLAHSSVERAPLRMNPPPPAGPTPLDLLLASFRSPATRPEAGPWEVVIEPYARAGQRTADAEASAILPSSHQTE